MKIVIGLLLLAGCAGGIAEWYRRHNDAPAGGFRTVALTRGELLATISATGTLEPEEVVDVGAQVAGQIVEFGADPHNPGKVVDYNTEVEQGTVLAKIDDALYKSDVDSNQAALDSAKASVTRAEADLNQFKAKLVQATNDWKRAQDAGPGVMAKADYDGYQAAFETAKANVAVGDAAITQAKTTVAQAQATLGRSTRNLGYCTITSPVKGTIIDRRVNKGQTVVSSLNAPSLFLIAKDLTRMQVWASVNEADIGNIHDGQAVTFTVDAQPNRVFKGTVTQVRQNASQTQNVVTYTVVITTDNSDKALKPYLTANVQFEVAKHENALMVPNVALRWVPTSAQQVSPDARDAVSGAGGGGGARQQGQATSQPAAAGGKPKRADGGGDHHRGIVWVQDGNFAKPIKVKIGLTDGSSTEVTSDDLKEGMQVITSEAHADDGTADAKNPFMPQFGQRRGTRGG